MGYQLSRAGGAADGKSVVIVDAKDVASCACKPIKYPERVLTLQLDVTAATFHSRPGTCLDTGWRRCPQAEGV